MPELKRLPRSQRVQAVRVGLLDTTLTRVSLGVTLARKGEFDRAVKQLERTAETYDAIHGRTSPQAANTRRRLGIVHLMAGRPREGKAAIDEALRAKLALAEDVVPTLSEAESLLFVATLSERDPALAALRLIPGATAEQAYDVVWSTRAMVTRALAERKSLADNDPKANVLIGRLQAVRSRLATLTLRPDAAFFLLGDSHGTLEELTTEKEQIERDLAEGCEPFRRQRERLRSRFTDLARRLPDGVAVVDFVRYYDWSDPKAAAPGSGPIPRFTAFVLRRDAVAPGYRLARLELGPAAPIDRDVTAWRAWLQAGVRGAGRGFKFRHDGASGEVDPAEARKRLREAVWVPLIPHLTDTSTVVVVPDGSLTRLPWSALPGDAPGRLLVEDIAVATATSGQQILEILTHDPAGEGRRVVVGGLAYDAAIAPGGDDPESSQSRGPLGPAGPWP